MTPTHDERDGGLALPGRVLWWALALAALVLHCWLLYSTNPPSPVHFAGSDKLAHFLIFGGTAGLFALAGVRPRVLWPVAVVHAVESELVQYFFVDGRSGSPWDAAADLCGVAFALWFAAVLIRRWGR